MKKYFAAAAVAAGLSANAAHAETLTRDCQVYPDKTGTFSLSLDTDTNLLTLNGQIKTPGLGAYQFHVEPMTGKTPSSYEDNKLLILQSPSFELTSIGDLDISATFNKPEHRTVVVHVARDWMWGPSTIRCAVPKPAAP